MHRVIRTIGPAGMGHAELPMPGSETRWTADKRLATLGTSPAAQES
jgi:hypothetical protein